MTAFISLIVLASGSSRAKSMAWADRLYQRAPTMSANLDDWYEARQAYEQVERRFGATDEILRRIASCNLRLLDLDAADKTFLRMKRPPQPLAEQTREKTRMRNGFQSRLPKGERVLDLTEGTGGEWIVLSGSETKSEFYRPICGLAFLRTLRIQDRGKVPAGMELAPPNEEGFYYGHLYTWQRQGRAKQLIVAYELTAMNCEPGQFQIFSLGKKNPKHLITVDAVYGIKGYPSRTHLAISTGQEYKVDWLDFYDWNGRHLALANDRHPNGYSPLPGYRSPLVLEENNLVYTNWLMQSAIECIDRKWDLAKRSLHMAEKMCRLCLSEQTRGLDRYREGGHPDYGHFGDTRENLGLIRRRLRWVKKHDYSHWQLYRPMLDDLQVRS